MPFNIKPENKDSAAVQSLKSALFNELSQNFCEYHALNKYGEDSGLLVGGNLSVLYSISGTRFDFDYKDKILVLEDLDEYLYHIDRMMMNMKYSDKLSKLKGLVVGGMTNMHDNNVAFGKTAYEIIFDAVKEYNYPVCFNFPVGHQNINLSLVFGSRVKLIVNKSGATLTYLND